MNERTTQRIAYEDVDVGQLDLHEEELIARREMRPAGTVTVRTEIEEFPGRVEVEAMREEAEVEHVPVGETVSERRDPWEQDGAMIVPVYEEQLVVQKRLFLREYVVVRRFATTEHREFQQPLRREKVVVEPPEDAELLTERS
jgi:uncharacterized protein (TIGR02271 family)